MSAVRAVRLFPSERRESRVQCQTVSSRPGAGSESASWDKGHVSRWFDYRLDTLPVWAARVWALEHLAFHFGVCVSRLEPPHWLTSTSRTRVKRGCVLRFGVLHINCDLPAVLNKIDLKTTCRRSNRHHTSTSESVRSCSSAEHRHPLWPVC